MSAATTVAPPRTPPTADQLRLAAELKAEGTSWKLIADDLGVDEPALRWWRRDYPADWAEAYAEGRRFIKGDVLGEALFTLRKNMRCGRPRVEVDAAGQVLRYWADDRRTRRPAAAGDGADEIPEAFSHEQVEQIARVIAKRPKPLPPLPEEEGEDGSVGERPGLSRPMESAGINPAAHEEAAHEEVVRAGVGGRGVMVGMLALLGVLAAGSTVVALPDGRPTVCRFASPEVHPAGEPDRVRVAFEPPVADRPDSHRYTVRMTPSDRDGVSVVLLANTPNPPVAEWERYLKGCGREGEVVVAPLLANPERERGGDVEDTPSLPLGVRRGAGAAFRTALETAKHPLVLLVADDYPYTPADLTKFLERMDTPSEIPDPRTGEYGMRLPDLVAGVRTGRPVPAGWKAVGWVVRNFCRFALGFPLDPLPGWYGFGEHLRAWRAWAVYGDPFHDPHCGFKLVRRSFLDRFPIQCDGDLVHVELAAKAAFLTCLVDELPLTPKPDAIPKPVWDRKDKRELFGRPKFWKAAVPGVVTQG